MASSAAMSTNHSEEGSPASVGAAPPNKSPASSRFPSFASSGRGHESASSSGRGHESAAEKKANKAPSPVDKKAAGSAEKKADEHEPGKETEAREEDAPRVKEGSEHINIKVKSQDGNEIYFKVRRTTAFKEIMLAYCRKTGADVDSVRFLFDGTRIRPEQTPDQLDMEDEDEVDALIAQTGGGGGGR